MGVVYLIRHGQASFGKDDYDALSGTGFAQARVLGEALRTRLPQVDVVATGGMRRHRETAVTCLAAMGMERPLQVEAGFREYDHEQVIQRYRPAYADKQLMRAELARSGDPRRSFQVMFAEAVARWMGGGHEADYDESWPVFSQRCNAALTDLVAGLAPSSVALVFTSGGVISAVAQQLLGVPDSHIVGVNWVLANCGLSKILYGERGLRLLTLNDHTAFEGAHAALISYR